MSAASNSKIGPRVAVIGNTCAGKTTTARALSRHLAVPHVELDALFWEPDWVSAPLEVFRQRVDTATAGDGWVLDGSYSKTRDIVWPRATDVVWLDPSFGVKAWRLLRRTTRRIARREELWNGNREQFGNAFLSRDSIFLWLIKTHGRTKVSYPLALRQPEHEHLSVVHLTSPRQVRTWLDGLSDDGLADA